MHESDIIIHKAAKKAFDDLALKTLPTVKSLQAEYSDLLVQKKLDYAGLAKARDEAKQLQIYKANAEILLRTDAEEQRQTRARQQEKIALLCRAQPNGNRSINQGFGEPRPNKQQGDFR